MAFLIGDGRSLLGPRAITTKGEKKTDFACSHSFPPSLLFRSILRTRCMHGGRSNDSPVSPSSSLLILGVRTAHISKSHNIWRGLSAPFPYQHFPLLTHVKTLLLPPACHTNFGRGRRGRSRSPTAAATVRSWQSPSPPPPPPPLS